MRKLVTLVAALMLCSGAAMAQETPKAEVFGGYSLLNQDIGGLFGPSQRVNIHGWNASLAGNVNRWFGVVADFSGHYRSSTDASLHTFTFGPQFSYRGNDKVTVFGRLLFGGARSHQQTTFAPFTFTDTAFALNVGAGLDWNASDRVAIRIVQYDAVIIPAGIEGHHRFSFGVVFRLGKK